MILHSWSDQRGVGEHCYGIRSNERPRRRRSAGQAGCGRTGDVHDVGRDGGSNEDGVTAKIRLSEFLKLTGGRAWRWNPS